MSGDMDCRYDCDNCPPGVKGRCDEKYGCKPDDCLICAFSGDCDDEMNQ